MGRPLKKIALTPEQIEYLASIGCTDTEIAILAGFKDSSGLSKRFSKILTKGREGGKTRLRKLQWTSAQKGNVAMLIWLGKQLLKQSDKVGIDMTGEARTINITVKDKTEAAAIQAALASANELKPAQG